MSTRASSKLLTADEFYELPDPKHGGKMELDRGRVVQHMPPGGKHGEITGLLAELINPFIRRNRLGKGVSDAGFLLSRHPDHVLAPDYAFIPAERVPEGGLGESYVAGFPKLAVEIVSPNDRNRDVMDKVADYLALGVEIVWVIRPRRRTVTVHTASGVERLLQLGDTLTSDDAGFDVPGFELPLADLFE